eukprot:3872136-Pyramimonas_sp.AAC.1
MTARGNQLSAKVTPPLPQAISRVTLAYDLISPPTLYQGFGGMPGLADFATSKLGGRGVLVLLLVVGFRRPFQKNLHQDPLSPTALQAAPAAVYRYGFLLRRATATRSDVSEA